MDVRGSSSQGAVVRRVPPRHCDAQGMMHASRPAEYFEDAFLAWLDGACGGYDALRDAGVDLVMAESTTRYRAPVRLGDEVVARAAPSARSRRSVTMAFELADQRDRRGDALVTASITYVCMGPTGAVALPPVLDAALAALPSPAGPAGRGPTPPRRTAAQRRPGHPG